MNRWFFLLGVTMALAGCQSPAPVASEDPTAGPITAKAQFTGDYLPGDQVDQLPVPTRQVAPKFPRVMRKAGLDGKAFVLCIVGVDGRPQQVQVEQASHELFARAAIEAVQRWEFRPGMKDGRPVATLMTIPVEFRRGIDTP